MKTKQVWKIGDCLEVIPEYPDNHFDLIIADPPYNINKADWDNIPDYPNWCMHWIKECQRVLKDNGSMYIFHSEMPTIARLMNRIEDNTNLIFRSMITWEKYQGNKQYFGRNVIMGVNADAKRNYYPMSEYILFYTFIDFTGSEMLSDTISSKNPIAKYLRDEIIRSGVSQSDIRQLFLSCNGNGTGALTNWLKGYNCPLKWQYERIRDYLNSNGNEYLKQEYEYLKQEYEDLRQEYESYRYTFNCHETDITRTWLYPPEKKEGHATPKPVELIKNIILHSSNEGDLILDPFCGSGKTLRACRETNRNCIGIEKDKVNIDLIEKIALTKTPTLDTWGSRTMI